MNVNELLQKFWTTVQLNKLGASSIALYSYIMYKYLEKESESIVISDVEISTNISVSRITIKKSREILYQAGLIKFCVKNGSACKYILFSNSFIEKENSVKIITKKVFKKTKIYNTKNSEINSVTIENINHKKNDISENIPTYSQFLNYAKSLKNYSSELDFKIEAKYESWVSNGWKTESKRPITDWEKALKNILPFIIESFLQNEKLKNLPNRNNLTSLND